MAPPFTLTFPRSSSSAYPQAGCQLVHAATFGTTADALMALTELWAMVRGWKGARLEVDGAPVLPHEQVRVGEALECAVRAATFPEPGPYCTSAPTPDWSRWRGRPTFPCRLVAIMGAVAVEAIEWDQPARRMIQVRALLAERGVRHCPFLALGPFEAALATWTPRRAAPPAPGMAGRRIEIGVKDHKEPADPPAPAIPDTVDELIREWPPEEGPR